MIASGSSKNQGGYTIMAKTVGLTAAIATRLMIEGKISKRGVISPVHKEIYEPCLKELEKHGIIMVETSDRINQGPKL
jgi:alpha-aminoadipic semialdehyde synthase